MKIDKSRICFDDDRPSGGAVRGHLGTTAPLGIPCLSNFCFCVGEPGIASEWDISILTNGLGLSVREQLKIQVALASRWNDIQKILNSAPAFERWLGSSRKSS